MTPENSPEKTMEHSKEPWDTADWRIDGVFIRDSPELLTELKSLAFQIKDENEGWQRWDAEVSKLRQQLAAAKPAIDRRVVKQWVVCAAIKSSEGKIIAGARHYDSVMRPLAFPNHERKGEWIECEQGFIDQFGAFLSRTDAWKIAEANGQIKDLNVHSAGVLYSEDLY
jgi:hypothetical protein